MQFHHYLELEDRKSNSMKFYIQSYVFSTYLDFPFANYFYLQWEFAPSFSQTELIEVPDADCRNQELQ